MRKSRSGKVLTAALFMAIIGFAPAAHAAWVMVVDQGEACPAGFVQTAIENGADEVTICVPAQSDPKAPADNEGPLEGPHFDGT